MKMATQSQKDLSKEICRVLKINMLKIFDMDSLQSINTCSASVLNFNNCYWQTKNDFSAENKVHRKVTESTNTTVSSKETCLKNECLSL